ncbi:hypothetical protein BGX27_002323 [Mortierella sp. AM989]|nr:hypothetical protein BGX27_002323 [Mortierella sp. AM989]
MARLNFIARNNLLLSLLTLSFLYAHIQAQSTTSVTPVSSPAYARFGTKLYVIGGGQSREVKNRGAFFTEPQFLIGDGQLIVLDLSIPWDAATPAWMRLEDGPKQMNFPGALSADGSKIITFRCGVNQSFAMLYDVATDNWSSSKIIVPVPDRGGIFAVSDPTTNSVFLPGGYDNNANLDQLYIYHFDNDTISQIPMISSPLRSSLYFNGVWWAQKKSILYFGGYIQPSADHSPNSVTIYTPHTNTWSTLPTTGTPPSGRSDMCLAISEDGSKLVVFGGRIITKPFYQTISSELFILDLNTKVWTLAKDHLKPRIYSICTIYNGIFISWGGSDATASVSEPAILYDLNRNRYVDKYMSSDPDSVADASGPEQSGNNGGGSGGSSSGISGSTIGIIVGSCAGVILIGFFLYRYDRKKHVHYIKEEHALGPMHDSHVQGPMNPHDSNNSQNQVRTTEVNGLATQIQGYPESFPATTIVSPLNTLPKSYGGHSSLYPQHPQYIPQDGAIQHGAPQYGAPQYNAPQYGAPQHSSPQLYPLPPPTVGSPQANSQYSQYPQLASSSYSTSPSPHYISSPIPEPFVSRLRPETPNIYADSERDAGSRTSLMNSLALYPEPTRSPQLGHP